MCLGLPTPPQPSTRRCPCAEYSAPTYTRRDSSLDPPRSARTSRRVPCRDVPKQIWDSSGKKNLERDLQEESLESSNSLRDPDSDIVNGYTFTQRAGHDLLEFCEVTKCRCEKHGSRPRGQLSISALCDLASALIDEKFRRAKRGSLARAHVRAGAWICRLTRLGSREAALRTELPVSCYTRPHTLPAGLHRRTRDCAPFFLNSRLEARP